MTQTDLSISGQTHTSDAETITTMGDASSSDVVSLCNLAFFVLPFPPPPPFLYNLKQLQDQSVLLDFFMPFLTVSPILLDPPGAQ